MARHAAVRQARKFCRTHPADVHVCWDLDNTLVDSGSLLRRGLSLQEAIKEAEPIANMLRFFETVQAQLPQAEHFVLSARRESMRADTMRWLDRHQLAVRSDGVCFLPWAEAKPAVWKRLARQAPLVIVDDLSFDHESETPRPYSELTKRAEQIAVVHVGANQIAEIAADDGAEAAIATRVAAALGRSEQATDRRG